MVGSAQVRWHFSQAFFRAGYEKEVQEVSVMFCSVRNTSVLINDLGQFVSDGEAMTVSVLFIGSD